MNKKLAHKADVVIARGVVIKNRWPCLSCCNPNCKGPADLSGVILYGFTAETLQAVIDKAVSKALAKAAK